MFYGQYAPSEVVIGERRFSLFFSMRAAARIEEAFQLPYPTVVAKLLQIPMAEGAKPLPMPMDEQRRIVEILLEEGGEDLSDLDLEELHILDFNILARAAQAEILAKSPKADAKKKESPRSR